MVDEIVLVPEMYPIVSMKSVVVPTFLPALSEVFSVAVLGGGGVVDVAAPLAVVKRQSQRECLSCRML